MRDRNKTVFACAIIKHELTEDEKASLRIIRLEREIVHTKQKLIELNQELDALIEEMIP